MHAVSLISAMISGAVLVYCSYRAGSATDTSRPRRRRFRAF
ncbi:MAG: hypothetical protein JWP03_3520, partial [Phycisphaerales bacterium]|nr:hypothetical protein [Phycisphaerales bacterium]